MKKLKLSFVTLFVLLGLSNIAKAECGLGSGLEPSCRVLNNSDAPANSAGHYAPGSLRDLVRSACSRPGNDDLNFILTGTSEANRSIRLVREAGPLTIPVDCQGSVTIEGLGAGRRDPVILDASAFNDTSSCAIIIHKNSSALRNVEIRGAVNPVCVYGDDVSVSRNVFVSYTGTAVTFNSNNSQFVGNTLGAYPDNLADQTFGLGQIGFFGLGSGNDIRENTIKYNRNAAIGVLAGSANKFISNVIAQNNMGISLVTGVNGGIEPPLVNSACAERDAGGTCANWNVSVTGRAGASAEIFLVDACWPDASSDASCTDNSGRGKGEAQKILARDVILSTEDPLSGCVALSSGRVRCTITVADPALVTGNEKITAIQTSAEGSSEFGINIPLNNTTILIPDGGFNIECLLRGTCGVPPSPTGTCGDGIVNQDSEACDGERGCSSTCQALPNFSCTRLDADSSGNVHSFCVETTLPYCGDGIVNRDYEACDGVAGCSTECEALPGWTCSRTAPDSMGQVRSTCTPPVTGLCGNAVCDATETAATCLVDCTPRAGCNFNNSCDFGETVTTCGHDCTSVVTPTCNRNGTCEVGESNMTCDSDCMVVPECNRDGVCNNAETEANCASDCSSTNPSCNRNGVCNAGETNATCPFDCPITATCNNNGTCDAGETLDLCPIDCRSVTPPPPTGFNPPSGLTAQPAPNQVTIRFNDDSTTEEGYRVSRADGECSATNVFTTVGTIPSSNPSATGAITYIDTASVYNGTYCYRVTGYRGNETTPFAQVQVTVEGGTIDPGIGIPPGGEMQGSGCSLVGGAANSSALLSFAFGLIALVGFRRRLIKE